MTLSLTQSIYTAILLHYLYCNTYYFNSTIGQLQVPTTARLVKPTSLRLQMKFLTD